VTAICLQGADRDNLTFLCMGLTLTCKLFCKHVLCTQCVVAELCSPPYSWYCGRALWYSIVAEYYGTVLWQSIVAQYCGTVLWQSIMTQYCGRVLWHSIVAEFYALSMLQPFFFPPNSFVNILNVYSEFRSLE
jgi:hypothetical protein